MGGEEDSGMSAIQKIRPRPSTDKFSVSKYCLHSLTKIVLSLLPRQIPGSQIWIFVTMFSTQIWEEEDVEKQVACILNMERNLNSPGKWVKSQSVFQVDKCADKTVQTLNCHCNCNFCSRCWILAVAGFNFLFFTFAAYYRSSICSHEPRLDYGHFKVEIVKKLKRSNALCWAMPKRKQPFLQRYNNSMQQF